MKQPQPRKPPKPWEHIWWEERDALALQALESGTASEGQQKIALAWILEACCLTEQSFVPPPHGDAYGRIDAFVEGKRQVGRQIRNLLRLNLSKFREDKEGQS